MKKRKLKLAELRAGVPSLNNGRPSAWLVEAVGQEAADAATLFDALWIDLEPEGTRIRLREGYK